MGPIPSAVSGVATSSIVLAIIASILISTVVFWIAIALLIKRGRRKRAERLAANPTAYTPTSPVQDWHGDQS
jgi:predicted permease